jgi:hypothetical protein
MYRGGDPEQIVGLRVPEVSRIVGLRYVDPA